MYDKITKKVLERFRDKLVVRKSDLVELIRDDVSKNPGNPSEMINVITNILVQRKMITPLYMSQSTFAITQIGVRE